MKILVSLVTYTMCILFGLLELPVKLVSIVFITIMLALTLVLNPIMRRFLEAFPKIGKALASIMEYAYSWTFHTTAWVKKEWDL